MIVTSILSSNSSIMAANGLKSVKAAGSKSLDLTKIVPLSNQDVTAMIRQSNEVEAAYRAAEDKFANAGKIQHDETKNYSNDKIKENNDVYLYNIASLNLDLAKASLDHVNSRIELDGYKGKNIIGTYNQQKTSSINEYVSWLNQHISLLSQTPEEKNTLAHNYMESSVSFDQNLKDVSDISMASIYEANSAYSKAKNDLG